VFVTPHNYISLLFLLIHPVICIIHASSSPIRFHSRFLINRSHFLCSLYRKHAVHSRHISHIRNFYHWQKCTYCKFINVVGRIISCNATTETTQTKAASFRTELAPLPSAAIHIRPSSSKFNRIALRMDMFSRPMVGWIRMILFHLHLDRYGG